MTAQKTQTEERCVIAGIPKLPVTVRYYDDFSNSYIEILQPDALKMWVIQFNGRHVILDFERLDEYIRPLVTVHMYLESKFLAEHFIRRD